MRKGARKCKYKLKKSGGRVRGRSRRRKEEEFRAKASLTVEAALVMPLFLFGLLTCIYFIQLFTLQDFIQSAITQMGLNMAKTAYVYEDFTGMEEALNFDETILGARIELRLGDFAKSIVDEAVLKLYSKKYLDINLVNKSCIRNGFEGMRFQSSSILKEENCIDLVVRYKVVFPIKLLALPDINILQRVRVRAWTGYEVAAKYSMEKAVETEIVYVTETGSVYHKSAACSHIRLSVSAVAGLPTSQRNTSGGKYYSCESCCAGEHSPFGTYYITSYGTRYHTKRDCSRIKRNVKEIPLSEAGRRSACKRCGQKAE